MSKMKANIACFGVGIVCMLCVIAAAGIGFKAQELNKPWVEVAVVVAACICLYTMYVEYTMYRQLKLEDTYRVALVPKDAKGVHVSYLQDLADLYQLEVLIDNEMFLKVVFNSKNARNNYLGYMILNSFLGRNFK
jgi:hypothetical protein